MSKDNLATKLANLSMEHLDENKGPQSHQGSITPTTINSRNDISFHFDTIEDEIIKNRESLEEKLRIIDETHDSFSAKLDNLADNSIITPGELQGYKTAIAKSSIILTNKNKALEQQKNALQFHSDTLQKLSNSKFDFMCEEE